MAIDVTRIETAPEDIKTMGDIAERWRRIQEAHGLPRTERAHTMMDLVVVHDRVGLRLSDLLGAGEVDFVHDIRGIARHLNRESGVLEQGFLPRFAATDAPDRTTCTSATYSYTLNDIAVAPAGSPTVCPREGCGGDARASFEFIPGDALITERDSREESYRYDGETTVDWDGQQTFRTADGLPIVQCGTCLSYFVHPDLRID